MKCSSKFDYKKNPNNKSELIILFPSFTPQKKKNYIFSHHVVGQIDSQYVHVAIQAPAQTAM
jgi:hypothetical protein